MKHLQNVSIDRILKTKSPVRRRQRFYCHIRMMWIYLTGCRPQEISHLTHADIELGPDVAGEESFKLQLRDEYLKHPSHKRIVVPLPGFAQFFIFTVLPEAGFGPDDFIFAGPDRRVIGKSNKMFRRLLNEAALDNQEMRIDPRSPYYSLRHTFITERLYEGMEIGRLARWCGTSVGMIERHYAHIRSDIEMSPTEQKPFNPVIVPLPTGIRESMLTFEDGFRSTIEEETARLGKLRSTPKANGADIPY